MNTENNQELTIGDLLRMQKEQLEKIAADIMKDIPEVLSEDVLPEEVPSCVIEECGKKYLDEKVGHITRDEGYYIRELLTMVGEQSWTNEGIDPKTISNLTTILHKILDRG